MQLYHFALHDYIWYIEYNWQLIYSNSLPEGARKRQQARSEEEEKAIAVSDPQELAKFNSFVDALYRRIGVHFRSRSDPFTVKLAKARSTKKSTKSKKSPKKGKSAKKTRSSKYVII